MDPVSCINAIHLKGPWVTGGFIVGFDSDTEDIFEQHVEFIERTAIPWTLINFLHALPRTALYDRISVKGASWNRAVAAVTAPHPISALSWSRTFC